jgi:hypothetical protein
MVILWTLIATVITFILGYVVLPLIGGVATMAVMMVLRPISKMGSYFISRYAVFVAEMYAYVLAVEYIGEHISAWMVLPWIAFAYCAFASFNTLFQFDVMCYRSQSGIWAIARHDASVP